MAKTNVLLGTAPPVVEEDIDFKVQELFKQYDQNIDGNLQQQEFVKVFANEDIIQQFMDNCGLITKQDKEQGQEEQLVDLQAELNLLNQETNEQDSKRKDGVEHDVLPGDFEEEQVQEGDQFMAVKPWVGAVKNSVPSNFDPKDPRLGKQPD